MVYASKYFNEKPPIKFGFNSIFYRANAWLRFRRITLLIRKFGGTGRVLDVGCALGNSMSAFSQAGLKPTGCDISVWATEWAKKAFPALEIVRLTHFVCHSSRKHLMSQRLLKLWNIAKIWIWFQVK